MENRNLSSLSSLANIAHDSICSKNPFPALNLDAGGFYGCKWGLTDLYPENEKILRSAIDAHQTFDTGWVSCNKEIRSFRIISDGKLITIQASAAMDDFDNLIYDAMDTEVELTEEQIEMLNEYWDEAWDMDTETMSEETVPVTTYEAAMEILSKLENENDERLNSWFEVVKSWVQEVISLSELMKGE